MGESANKIDSVTRGKIDALARIIVKRKLEDKKPFSILLGADGSIGASLSDRKGVSGGSKLESNVSKGYHYLAHLIAQGYIDNVFTTNWDSYLEDVLPLQIKYSDFKLLIRGEHTDEIILSFLKNPSPRAKLVKLHGDLGNSNLAIINKMTEFLKNNFFRDVIVIGHSVNHVGIHAALNSRSGNIWYVSPNTPSESDFIIKAMDDRGCKKQLIVSKFGDFFIELTRKIEERTLRKSAANDNGENIVRKQLIEKGANYLDIDWVQKSVVKLCDDIKKEFQPDLIVYIHDLEAPGGSEVKKWIEKEGSFPGIPTQEIRIKGGRNENINHRGVQGDFIKQDGNVSKILLLDNVTFSGQTFKIAIEKIRKVYGVVTLKLGLLVVGRAFLEKLHANEIKGLTINDIFYVKETDRAEIFFPWGYTQSTYHTAREVSIFHEKCKVDCFKRPWGSIEAFSENKFCSVRLLTINAGQCLSEQRHLCREEFFIPLDDNIGLQIEDEKFVIEKGDYIVIPRGTWHRIFAYKNSGRVLELSFGYYDQINDIKRRKDRYGRVNKDGSC